MHYKLKWIALAVALMLCAGFALGCVPEDERPADTESTPAAAVVDTVKVQMPETASTVSSVGTGKLTLEPDMATVYLSVEVEKDTAAQASTALAEQINAVTAKLRELGVKDEDLKTTDYGLYQREQYDGDGNPTGKTTSLASCTVSARLYDLDSVGKVIDQAIAAGANNANGVYYSLKDPDAYDAQVLKLAVEDAQARAQAMAEAVGKSVGEAVVITEGSVSDVQPIYRNADEAAAEKAAPAEDGAVVNFSPGTLELTADVTVQFVLK